MTGQAIKINRKKKRKKIKKCSQSIQKYIYSANRAPQSKLRDKYTGFYENLLKMILVKRQRFKVNFYSVPPMEIFAQINDGRMRRGFQITGAN